MYQKEPSEGFLRAVKRKKIPQGSFLLVESLDRLSRQEIRKSLTLFLSIIDAGVNIVTLADGHVYTAQKTELQDLLFSLVIMSRAHEESQTKSLRVGAAWANKRANATTRPLTAMCPAWLRLSKDKTHYEVNEQRAKIVRSIFEDSVAGMGAYAITRRLNGARVPHFGRSRGWCNSYVNLITINRAVLGEFQPHQMINGKRVPAGPSIPNYFPAIVDHDLFYRAQALRQRRKTSGRGRKGKYVSNLFTRLATCAYCHSPMRFENKGHGPKGGTYLCCDNSRRGLGCEPVGWRYDEFEASFLAFVKELDLSQIIGTDDAKATEIDHTIAALRGELLDIENQREKTYKLLQKVDAASDYVAQKLNELENRRAEVEKEAKEKTTELTILKAKAQAVRDSDQDFKKLTAALRRASGDGLYKLRAQIADRIRSVCIGIYIAPLGPNAKVEVASVDEANSSVIATMKKHVNDEAANRRFFAVEFQKSLRIVFPADDDPTRLDMMRYIGPSGPAVTLVLAPRGREGR